MIVSQTIYVWFVTLMTAVAAAGWIVVDTIRLRRALRRDRTDPVTHDLVFGSIVGLAMCALAVAGAVAYHL